MECHRYDVPANCASPGTPFDFGADGWSPMPARDQIFQLKQRIAHAAAGQNTAIAQRLLALLADGYVVMEDLPGLTKTRRIKTLTANLQSEFRRIRFTR